MQNVYEQVDKNKLKSTLVVFLFFVFVTVVIYLIGRAYGYAPSFVGLALIVSGISTFIGYWYSDKVVIAISGARKANSNEDNLFRQVAQNIAIAAQIPVPSLYIIDDTAPNAFATGRDIEHAAMCITTGLLQKLNRTELEGVIGHELSHIKNYDTRLMSVVSVLLGSVILLSDWLLRSSFRGRDNDNKSNSLFMIIGLITALLAPFIGQLIQLALSRQREFLADAGSAMLTRQPSGLISALKIIASDSEPLEAANKATSGLYIVNPFKQDSKGKGSVGWFANLFNTHPPVGERIQALEKML